MVLGDSTSLKSQNEIVVVIFGYQTRVRSRFSGKGVHEGGGGVRLVYFR